MKFWKKGLEYKKQNQFEEAAELFLKSDKIYLKNGKKKMLEHTLVDQHFFFSFCSRQYPTSLWGNFKKFFSSTPPNSSFAQ